MTIRMNLGENSYDIVIEHGVLFRAAEHLNLNRRVCVVTDSGVPAKYAATVAAQCREARIITFPEGEASKNLDTFSSVLRYRKRRWANIPKIREPTG